MSGIADSSIVRPVAVKRDMRISPRSAFHRTLEDSVANICRTNLPKW